jgi:hypothetical protein
MDRKELDQELISLGMQVAYESVVERLKTMADTLEETALEFAANNDPVGTIIIRSAASLVANELVFATQMLQAGRDQTAAFKKGRGNPRASQERELH